VDKRARQAAANQPALGDSALDVKWLVKQALSSREYALTQIE
jgi:hypothetical protein